MVKVLVAVLVSAGAVVASGCASVDTGPPRDVAGTWGGQCSDCPVKAFRLVLTQNGQELSGSLQASGRTGLGEREMPLLGGKVAGRTVTFQTKGADGVTFDATLRVGDDGQTMFGQGQHRAAFGLSFTRAGR